MTSLRVCLFLLRLCCATSLLCAGCQNGDSQAKDSAAPVLGQVPAFALTDSKGHPFGSSELAGKPYLATFIFTRCPSVCPRVTARMKQVDAKMKSAGLQLELLSISVDPQFDRPSVLRAYAEKHGAALANWHFVTGPYEEIARTAEQGFRIGLSGKADTTKPHAGITHGSHLVLVDGHGQIRGYFRSSDADSVQQLVEAVRNL